MPVKSKRIVLIIGGGIAAYKCLELIRRAREKGIAVRAVMTKAAAEFVTPLSVSALTNDRVFSNLFDLDDEREIGHKSLTRLHIVENMHQRKALMADLTDGFVALPGGIGTMEELFEVYTWGQLGLHKKAVALLDVEGYYAPLVQFLDHSVTEGFVRPEHRGFLLSDTRVDPLLDAMIAWRPPKVAKWMERGQT